MSVSKRLVLNATSSNQRHLKTFLFLQWEQNSYLFFCGYFCLKTLDDVAHVDTAELLHSPSIEVLLRSCSSRGCAGSKVLLAILRSCSAAATGLKCEWRTGSRLGYRVCVPVCVCMCVRRYPVVLDCFVLFDLTGVTVL